MSRVKPVSPTGFMRISPMKNPQSGLAECCWIKVSDFGRRKPRTRHVSRTRKQKRGLEAAQVVYENSERSTV